MKISLNLRPTIFKAVVPLVLVGGAFLPLEDYVRIFYQVLWIPLIPFLRFPPFVASDKPFFVMTEGAVAAGCLWSLIFYLLLSLRFQKK